MPDPLLFSAPDDPRTAACLSRAHPLAVSIHTDILNVSLATKRCSMFLIYCLDCYCGHSLGTGLSCLRNTAPEPACSSLEHAAGKRGLGVPGTWDVGLENPKWPLRFVFLFAFFSRPPLTS